MHIRPETPADFAAIANVHILAFGNRSNEATLTMLLRQREAYDPELALVAEIDGKVVGHALFTPYMVLFAGIPIRGVNLAPLGIHPDYQRQGVGSALMEAGHAAAYHKGYELSFLLGHSSYYPRFGYQTRVFAGSSVTITSANVSGMALPVKTRQPQPEDVAALKRLWLAEEEDVEFALEPEANLNAWLSPNPAYPAVVYYLGNDIIGYSRGRPDKPQVFLAKHEPAAHDIAVYLLREYDTLTLPLHAASRSMRAFNFDQTPPRQDPWEAAMLKMLCFEPLVAHYVRAVQSGQRPPGRPIWPPAFDLVD